MVTKKKIVKKVATKKPVSLFHKMASKPKNKKMFSAYNDGNSKRLRSLGIGKIKVFDELGNSFSDWKGTDELVLSVLPMCDAFGVTKSKLKKIPTTKIAIQKEHVRSDFVLDSDYTGKATCGEVLYIKKQNLIVSLVNPFVDKETFDYVLECIQKLKPTIVYEKDLLAIELTELATKHIVEKKSALDNSIKTYNSDLIDIEKKHRLKLTKIKDAVQERKLLGNSDSNPELDRISKEVKNIMDMPVVKKVFLKEGIIHINFGQISVSGNVRKGTTVKGGIKVPKVIKERVELGEIEFTIGNGTVRCKNLTHPTENPHPHASTEGGCCFGDSSDDLNKLIVNFKLVELAKMLYAWALSYNEAGGPHRNLQFFYDRVKAKV